MAGADAPARLRVFLDAWNSHDLERVAALFEADAVIEDELVVIDPDRPAGRRTYRGLDAIRSFAALATPGFHAELVKSHEDGDRIQFVANVRADGLARRGIASIEQHDELLHTGGRVARFRIRYPRSSRQRLVGGSDVSARAKARRPST